MATFTRTDILEGLQRLGELAQEKGVTVHTDPDGWRRNGAGI